MKKRIRILAVISLSALIGIGVMTVFFPLSEMQFGTSMDTIAYETVAIRDSNGNLSTTYDDIYVLGMGDFNLSVATSNITIGTDVESIRVKSVLYREVLYDDDQPLNISFSEELNLYCENNCITKQVPDGFMFLDTEATVSSTKPLELTLSESTIDSFGISNIIVGNVFKFRVEGSADYTINYFVHIEVIQITEASPPIYVSIVQILLPAIGAFSAALLLLDIKRSGT
ncbi:MAG: hypothetical protein R6V83_01565 [Candidatus Thorarchaeota archaeon]